MATITILPETDNRYRARAGDKESTGRTAGEALDALASQLEDEQSGTLVIVQNHKADRFFNAAQQERLTELMQLRKDSHLSPEEESELESLVEAELDGARRRVEQKLRPIEESLLEYVLTQRERELIAMVLEGLPYKKIAEVLKVDESTVRHHIASIKATIRYHLKQTGRPAKDSQN